MLSAPRFAARWPLPAAALTVLDESLSESVHQIAGPLALPLLRIAGGGGKRLRPALTLAIAELGGAEPDGDVLGLAAAVELLHCATLVHDDLIDHAATRRGVATVSAAEGAPAAIVGGDMLIAAAITSAGRFSAAAGLVIAETLGRLCRGEARQEQSRYDPETSIETVLEVAGDKTGSLFGAACGLGALAFDAPPELLAAVQSFGYEFGVCLQLLDDLLDIVSSPELAGKPVGADFAAGIVTLPTALAMRDHPELRELFTPGRSGRQRSSALELLRAADDAIAETVTAARRHADRAADLLRAAMPDVGPVADWPLAYLTSQLSAGAGDRHRWLLDLLPVADR